jgi:hypothetical protein
MKIIFTICSNNYLAQAKALGDSILQTNPTYSFFIGLADRKDNAIDYEKEIGHQIILAEDIDIPNFENLWKRYSIIEFNTCIKPFFFSFFFKNYPTVEFLYYLDPDTYVFGDLKVIEAEFGEKGTMLLTPHILTPISIDGKMPDESLFLNFGIYNLGFLGLKNTTQVDKFIEWWKERTYHLGYDRPSEGLFVDQLWINFVPAYYPDVIISKHPGLNMGPWNLHERILSEADNSFYINGTHPLIFYHFSNYKYTQPNTLSKFYNRYTFETKKDLLPIYNAYHNLLLGNGVQKMEKLSCHYMQLRKKYLLDVVKQSPKKRFMYFLENKLSRKAFKVLRTILD